MGRMGDNLARQTWKQMTRKAGESSEGQFFARVERVDPVRAPELEPDVLVPAAQGLVIGLGTFFVFLPVSALFFPVKAALAIGFVFGGIGTGLAALDAVIAVRRSLYSTESLSDNLMAKATSNDSVDVRSSTVELVVRREDVDGYPRTSKRELPVDEARLREFVSVVVDGESLAQNRWVGRDKLFSRTEFDETMAMFMELGLAVWKSSRNNAQGRVLSRGGQNALKAWLDGRTEFTRVGTQASSQQVIEAEG